MPIKYDNGIFCQDFFGLLLKIILAGRTVPNIYDAPGSNADGVGGFITIETYRLLPKKNLLERPLKHFILIFFAQLAFRVWVAGGFSDG